MLSTSQLKQLDKVFGFVGTRKAHFHIGFEDHISGRVKRTFHASELGHDLHAVFLFVHHLLQPPDLPLQAAQAVDNLCFVAVSVGNCRCSCHADTIPPPPT